MLDTHHISHDWARYEAYRLKKKTGIQTGFIEIDKSVRALPGITTLVGATGLGKSYFTMNIYVNLARKGIPVLLVDKEIGFVDVRTRLLCYLSGLTEPAITSGRFVGDEELRYNRAVQELKILPIYYFDDLKSEEVENLVTLTHSIYKTKVFLVVDSLNRLVLDFENRRADVDSWITLFNNLKLKYDNVLHMWIICEKNKQGEIKESNTIEYITELWLDLLPTKDKRTVILECKKQRNGPKGVIATLQNRLPFCYAMDTVEFIPE